MTAARRTAQPKAYPPPLQAVFDNPEGCRFGRWCTNMLPRELLADRAVGSGTVAIRSNVSWSGLSSRHPGVTRALRWRSKTSEFMLDHHNFDGHVSTKSTERRYLSPYLYRWMQQTLRREPLLYHAQPPPWSWAKQASMAVRCKKLACAEAYYDLSYAGLQGVAPGFKQPVEDHYGVVHAEATNSLRTS
jgi:hypothetical protein